LRAPAGGLLLSQLSSSGTTTGEAAGTSASKAGLTPVLAAELPSSGPVCSGINGIFLWMAGGISSARIQRLVGGENAHLGCHLTPSCIRALEKAGADAKLIHFLTDAGSNDPKTVAQPKAGTAGKSALSSSCKCAGASAEVAALVHARKLNVAEDKIHALLQDDPENATLLFVLGTVLRREDRLDESFDALSESAHRMPGFAETHGELSYYFYRNDDADSALAEARTALSIDPANAEAYRYLGLAHYAAGHYEAALNAFEKSLEREPDNADVYFDMGIAQRDKGDLRRAAIAYRHALALRPDFWEAHSNLGVVLRDQGKLDEAVAEYRTAVRLKPDEASVRSNLGNTLCDKEEFDKAIVEFKELYLQFPNWEGGHNCLARAYMSKRDYPAAIRELRAAIVQNPAGAAEYRVLGQALLMTGQDEEALSVLRKAVALNPESALGHHYLGTALVNTQDMAGAEKEFREALKLEPSAQNHYSLAACLMALNRYEEALGELEIASRLDPNENLYRNRMQEAARMITTPK
jgi:tetratricopeptide (TPR) repeat protein